MSNIDELNIHTPFNNNVYFKESNYVNVSQFKSLRLTTSSDVDCTLEIIFSVDSIHDGPSNSFRVSSVYSTRRVDVILPYLKIRLYKLNIENENHHLIINFLNHLYTPKMDKDTDEIEVEKESNSLFRNIMKRKSKNVEPKTEKIDVSDHRLPNLIPRNSLLVGSFNNSITTVPPPDQPNSILMYDTNNKYVWVSVYELGLMKSINLCDIN